MQILSPAWSVREEKWAKVRDMVQGSVRTERSISRKQNCSAHNLCWPSISKPSLADCHISMNYSFSSFLGRSLVSTGYQLLFRAWYVVCLFMSSSIYCNLFRNVLFYLFIYHHFINSAQAAMNSQFKLVKKNSPSFGLCTSGMLRCCRWNTRKCICDRAVCLSYWDGPVALIVSCNSYPEKSRSTKRVVLPLVPRSHTLDLSPALLLNYLRPLRKKNVCRWFSTDQAINPRGHLPLAQLCVFQEGPAPLEENLRDKLGPW